VVVRLFEEPRWVQLYPRVLRSLRSLWYPGVKSGFRLRCHDADGITSESNDGDGLSHRVSMRMVVRLFEEPLWGLLYPRVLRSLRSLRYPGV